MIIREAEYKDFNNIMSFYYDLIDTMQYFKFHPGWKKDIYPSRQFIYNSIIQKELYVGVANDDIISAMVINNSCAKGYDKASWKIKTDEKQVAVIHALGISSHHQGQGIAKRMIAHAVNVCKKKGMKAIRLDVLLSNKPAHQLYVSMGFAYIDTIKLFYEDTGLTDYLLYELVLET